MTAHSDPAPTADYVRISDLLWQARDCLDHRHGPDDGDTCFACYLESEIDKALQIDGTIADG